MRKAAHVTCAALHCNVSPEPKKTFKKRSFRLAPASFVLPFVDRAELSSLKFHFLRELSFFTEVISILNTSWLVKDLRRYLAHHGGKATETKDTLERQVMWHTQDSNE